MPALQGRGLNDRAQALDQRETALFLGPLLTFLPAHSMSMDSTRRGRAWRTPLRDRTGRHRWAQGQRLETIA